MDQGGDIWRRWRRTIVASATATVILGVGVVVVLARQGSDDNGPAATGGLPDDTQVVGIGQAAVTVPAAWAINEASCNTPFGDTAYFPWPQDCMIGTAHSVSSVALTTGAFSESGTVLAGLEPNGRISGHQVLEGRARCSIGPGDSCRQVFGIPDLDAYFTVTIPEAGEGRALDQIAAIRDSLTVLPEDQTTVAFVPWGVVEEVDAALSRKGLKSRIEETPCPPNASCVAGVVSTEPAAGSVVQRGSTVVLNVMGP